MFENLFDFSNPLTFFGGQKRAAAQQKARGVFNQQFSNLPSSFGGRPANFVSPARTSVVRPQTYVPPFPTPPRIPLSAAGEAFRQESQGSQGAGPGLPLGSFTDGRTVTIPKPPDYIPGGDEKTITTDPGNLPMPDPYPTVLPSLSAEQLGQLSERRRLIDERLKQAEAESERRNTLAAASAERSRQDASRGSRRSVESFMRQAGGRGLARSPMVAGRAVRRAGEDLRLAYGEIDTNLSTEMLALQDLVSRAENERNIALAGIEQERVNMQADLSRLFPAASMYR